MATIKAVVDKGTADALAQGQYGHFKDRAVEMRDHLLSEAAKEGYTRDQIEQHVGHDLDEYCEQQLDSVWPHDAGEA